MIIYQLHEYTGQWEDYCDFVVGSYLKRERAEQEKIKAQINEKELIDQSKKCVNCPFLNEDWKKKDILLNRHKGYCSMAKLMKDNISKAIDCENFYFHADEATYEIIEVEVEE
jgi:hypothetical protein